MLLLGGTNLNVTGQIRTHTSKLVNMFISKEKVKEMPLGLLKCSEQGLLACALANKDLELFSRDRL